jgi:selenocysteine-specific elongation factor
VALAVGAPVPSRLLPGAALVSPKAFLDTEVVDVRLDGDGVPPERPLLHIGSAAVAVHARPLADGLARLTLGTSLPLRVGDRAILRDPGSRHLWGVHVLDPLPPRLARRGAARERARELETVDGTLASEVRRRGVVHRSVLEQLGAAAGPPDEGAVSVDDWLLSADQAASLRQQLVDFMDKASTAFDRGVTLEATGRALGLPDPGIVAALVTPPLRVRRGRVLHEAEDLPARLEQALSALRADLREQPFAAPDAARLKELGLDTADLVALARDDHVLRVGDTVLLPGADVRALEVLRALPQPFTTSQARQALGTSRRVALPLLAHLDRTGHTVRLPDDRRRLRG